MRGIGTLLAILAVLSVAGCSERPRALPKILVTFSRHISWAPILIAKAEGDFEREGLDVEIVTSLRSEESLVALVTGAIDVRPGPISTGMLSAIAQGANIRVVAGMGVLDPAACTYFGIVVHPDVDTAAARPVAKMRASIDGTSRYIVDRMLTKAGRPLRDIETVRIPEVAMLAALRNHSIDAIAVSEPLLRQGTRFGRLWLAGEDAAPGFQWAVVAFGERLLTRQPALGVAFMRGYRRGLARYQEGKTARNIEILAAATNEPADLIRSACWLTIPERGVVHWPSIDAFQQWAITDQLMDRRVDSAQVIDQRPLAASASLLK